VAMASRAGQQTATSCSGNRPPNCLGEAFLAGVLDFTPVLLGEFGQCDLQRPTDSRICQVERPRQAGFNGHQQPWAFGLDAVVPVVGFALLQSGGVSGASVDGGEPLWVPTTAAVTRTESAEHMVLLRKIDGLETERCSSPGSEPFGMGPEFVTQLGEPRVSLNGPAHDCRTVVCHWVATR